MFVTWRWLPLVVALVLRVGAFPLADLEQPALYEYGSIARHLSNGDGYINDQYLTDGARQATPSAWMPPAQPFITAALFYLFGDGFAGILAQFLLNCLLGTLAVWAGGVLAFQVFKQERHRTIALWLGALYPPFIVASTTFGITSSVLLLNALLVIAAVRLYERVQEGKPAIRHALTFGLLGGLLALFRSEAPIVMVALGSAFLWQNRARLSQATIQLSVAAVAMTLVILPWTLRNVDRFDQVILGSTSGGYNLWRGNNPNATGSGWTEEGRVLISDPDITDEITARTKQHGDWAKYELISNQYHTQLALEHIRNHPAETLGLALRKLVFFWTVDWYYPHPSRWVYAVFHLTLLGLVLIGFKSLRAISTPSVRIWRSYVVALALALSLITMVFFSLPRYQILFMGVLHPLACVAIDRALSGRRHERQAEPTSSVPRTMLA